MQLAPDTTETRYYTVYNATFRFSNGAEYDAKVIWPKHYHKTKEAALCQQNRELSNLIKAIKLCPSAIKNIEKAGIIPVKFKNGSADLPNRSFMNPLGLAYAIGGEILDLSDAVWGGKPTPEIFIDGPSNDLAMLLTLMSPVNDEGLDSIADAGR